MIIAFRWVWHATINLTKTDDQITYYKMIDPHTICSQATRAVTIQSTEMIIEEAYALFQQIYVPLIFSISRKTVRNILYFIEHHIDFSLGQRQRQFFDIQAFHFLMVVLPVLLLTFDAAVSNPTARSTTLWSCLLQPLTMHFPSILRSHYGTIRSLSLWQLNQSKRKGNQSNIKRLFNAYCIYHAWMWSL